MKILFFSHKFYPDIGGIEVNSEILANQFSNLGAQVKLVTWTKEEDGKKFGFEVIRNPSFKNLYKLYKWSEVVYENNPVMRMSWLNMIFLRPRIVAVRTWIRRMDGKRSIMDWLKKFWVNNATEVIAISEAVKKDTSKRAIVIGNPYRSNNFKSISNNKNKDFIFLGRLVSDKGADMCIQLIHKLKEKFDEKYSLTIVGDGPEMKSLLEMLANLKLGSQVKLMGFLKGEKLINSLNQHQYLLVPSRWEEPFGNVALEGMACGCIPIVSNGGGLPDAAGDAGIVFKRNSLEDLVKKTYELLKNPKKQGVLTKKAKHHLCNHTELVIGKRYFDVLIKALNK